MAELKREKKRKERRSPFLAAWCLFCEIKGKLSKLSLFTVFWQTTKFGQTKLDFCLLTYSNVKLDPPISTPLKQFIYFLPPNILFENILDLLECS